MKLFLFFTVFFVPTILNAMDLTSLQTITGSYVISNPLAYNNAEIRLDIDNYLVDPDMGQAITCMQFSIFVPASTWSAPLNSKRIICVETETNKLFVVNNIDEWINNRSVNIREVKYLDPVKNQEILSIFLERNMVTFDFLTYKDNELSIRGLHVLMNPLNPDPLYDICLNDKAVGFTRI